MKKIISTLLIGILLISGLFILTGCNNKKEPEAQEVEMKKLEYVDEKSGNKVTFEYLPEENYEITDEDEDGKFLRMDVENESLNLAISMYLVENDYDYEKDSQKESDNFKEYTAGNYKGFMYTESNGLTIQNKVLLVPETEEDYALSMYMYIEKLDYNKETDLVETFNSDAFQRFLSSIKYEKIVN